MSINVDLKSQVGELMDISPDANFNSIRLKDLPRLLAEYEQLKGHNLLNEDSKVILEGYVKDSPELKLGPEKLLEMIQALNATRDGANSDDNGSASDEGSEGKYEQVYSSSPPSGRYHQVGLRTPPLSAQSNLLGLGTPSELFRGFTRPRVRPRMYSLPEAYRAARAGKVAGVPRSASSTSTGLAFPRGNTSYAEESSDNSRSDGWDHVSDERASSPFTRSASGASVLRSGSDGSASPALDETNYRAFSALSPTLSNEYIGPSVSSGFASVIASSRRSSGAGRRRSMQIDEEGEETTMEDANALRARLEVAQRQLQEKERQYDEVQHEHDLLFSKLQDEAEEIKTQLSANRREIKESKVRENSHLDSIATLEADLNKSEKALESTRDHLARAKVNYEDQVVETGRLRAKVSELQEAVQKYKTEERLHVESAKGWDGDRETYRRTIKELHEHVDEVETEVRRLQEGERENSVLRERLERVTIELEEVRRGGSSIMGSRYNGSEADATLSRRLGTEMAREIARTAMLEGEQSDDSDVTAGANAMAGSDESVNATFIVRKVRRSNNRAGGSLDVHPPSYDVDAIIKEWSDRVHPEMTAGEPVDDVQDPAYWEMATRAGKRCTALEEMLKVYAREHAVAMAAEAKANEPIVTPVESWNDRLGRKWEEWIIVLVTLFAWLFSFFSFMPYFSKSPQLVNAKPSKRQEIVFTVFTTALAALIVGLIIGHVTSRSSTRPFYDDDFHRANSLDLRSISLSYYVLPPQEEPSWFSHFTTSAYVLSAFQPTG